MKARAEVGREEEGPLLTQDLRYYWEGAREWCGDNKWDKGKKMLQRYIINNITTSK